MKLLTLELPGVVVKKAGKARVAVPGVVNGPHGMHWAAKAGRAKKQRTAAQQRLRDKLGAKVLLVAKLTRVAPRRLDDDNLRPALKAYRDGVADALGLTNDRPGWLSWEYAQETCPMGEPERVRLEVSAVGDSTWGIGVAAPLVPHQSSTNQLGSVRTKRGPTAAYMPPRTVRMRCASPDCNEPALANSGNCAAHVVEDIL